MSTAAFKSWQELLSVRYDAANYLSISDRQKKNINGQLDLRHKNLLAMPEENEKIECGYGQEHVERTHLEQLRGVTRLLPQIP